jgi:hypothetical protein
MKTEAKVYYWKDIKYLTQLEFAGEDEVMAVLPNRKQFENDYAYVATLHPDCHDCGTLGRHAKDPLVMAELCFELLNTEPHRHVLKYVGHTAMSVGDIVIIGELALIVMPVGFKKLILEAIAE